MKKQINPISYKVALLLIKVIPMLVALCYGANTLLAFFDVDLEAIGYACLLLFVILLYVLSYVFRFCSYHRMFIHYILIIDVTNIIDYYIGIPMPNARMLGAYFLFTVTMMFITLFLYVKQNKYRKKITRGKHRTD